MAKSSENNIFELNGQAYDSRSGAQLGPATRVPYTTNVQAVPVRRAPVFGSSMDGMVSTPGLQPLKPKATQHVVAHQQQHTKTLMRHAVKIPQPGQFQPGQATSDVQAQGALQPQIPTHVVNQPKFSTASVSPLRAHRSRVINRSQAVDHFRPARLQPQQPVASQAAYAPQPVQAQPLVQVQPLQQAVPVQQSTRQFAAARRPYATQPQAMQVASPAQTDLYDDLLEQDIFEQALASADSHEQPAAEISASKEVRRKGSRARKALTIAASLSVFVALCGLVAFQNRQQIQLQMASAKAGFAATTPLYTPQGYKADKLTYASGSVAFTYASKGKRPFVILQKKSNWDSQTLLDNFVAVSNQDYRGFQSNGRTVYVIGEGSATWVNGGIWYQIKEANGMTDEQLVKIAASM